MPTARRIRTLTSYAGDAALYRLDPPLPATDDNGWGSPRDEVKYVVLDATITYQGAETMAFAADEIGEVTNWTDLAVVHALDHAGCLARLGYTIA